MGLDLVNLRLAVQFGERRERVRGNQPDLIAVGISCANQVEWNLGITEAEYPNLFVAGRDADLLGASWLVGNGVDVAGEPTIDHDEQLFGKLFPLVPALRIGQLQILGCGVVFPKLCRLEKAENGATRRASAQRIRVTGSRARTGAGRTARSHDLI